MEAHSLRTRVVRCTRYVSASTPRAYVSTLHRSIASEFLAHATRVLSVALQSGNAHVALQGATRMATQAYYRGDGGCPSAITFRPPGVNQRKRAARAFAANLSSGDAIRAIFHRGYQHATAA